ncbi:hypothetical protein BKA70DRAFT_1438258 [Coprinopsis sp. MPI-PUGE-AT-0042]|nr:hypothetical protein BKA70DRAFT_1438258 [Coprinopsis sp. MPI-PUGE-AT-0042]
MTYSEVPYPPVHYRSSPLRVLRAQDHPLQPIEGASTFVVEGFAHQEDAEVFVKEMFGLEKIGFRRYLMKPGDRVVWRREPGANVSNDQLILDAAYEGYPDRTAAVKAHDLPEPSLSMDDLGVSAVLRPCGGPGPVLVDGHEEYEVEKIVDECVPQGDDEDKASKYRVRWKGWDPQSDSWITAKDAKDLRALDQWLGV